MAQLINIQNLASFLRSVEGAKERVSDISSPMKEIREDWMRTNRLLFALSGPGSFADLSDGRNSSTGRFQKKSQGTKAQKEKRWGFIYPMFRASGRLESSLTESGDADSLFELLNNETLIIGSKAHSKSGASYPYFLQHGTRFMPARKFLKVDEISIIRWKNILRRHVIDSISSATAPKKV